MESARIMKQAPTVGWRIPSEAYPLIGMPHGANLLRACVQLSLGQRIQHLSVGARSLGEWLMRDSYRQCAFDGIEGIGLADIDRILIGVLQPGDAMCEIIARATDGVILPDMFDKFPPALDDLEFDPETIGAGFVSRTEVLRENNIDEIQNPPVTVRMDTLGSIGAGPIAEVWPFADGYFVKLPGVIAAVDRGTALGLQAALGKALHVAGASGPPDGGHGGMHGYLSG